VATGFPAGQTPLPQRTAEIEQAIEAGAREIDVVIRRTHVLTGNWQALYDELRLFRETCGDVHMKTILATGDLGTLKQVYQASLVAMMAGSDFIKTSTGKESVNATLEFGLVMARAIRAYETHTGYKVGFKPAGGISKAKQALTWQSLMKEELGEEWLMPDLFRFGASSLLTDLERQLYHYLTGRYAARHHMPMG
jgi:deoxyribose-phosphate aldolase